MASDEKLVKALLSSSSSQYVSKIPVESYFI